MSVMRKSGLDIDLGNRCSQIAFSWAQKTFGNRKLNAGRPVEGLEGAFSNLVRIGEQRLAIASDGIGTKVELAERTGSYHTLGFDLVAMVADDLAANGIEPVNLSNVLDVDELDPQIVDALMRGLCDACGQAKIAVTGGEIAELGKRVGGYGSQMHFNWSATAIGVLAGGRKPIDGQVVAVGDAIVGLRSRGFRSNGFSLARRLLQRQFGDSWHEAEFALGQSWGEVLLAPSLIYAPLVCGFLREGNEISGVAHITGGGIGDNLQRVLKCTGLGARLDELFAPHDAMLRLQELGDVNDETAYRLWNMGVGMLVTLPPPSTERFVRTATNQGYEARQVGVVIEENEIQLHSRGIGKQKLVYKASA